MRAALLLVGLAACDPFWGVDVRVHAPVDNVTVAVACPDGARTSGMMAVRTAADGRAHLGGLGSDFPVGCDVYVAKPGFVTHRIRYKDLCPAGPDGCDRVFAFDLVLEPE
jgi:hypothetical protein